MGTLKHRPLTFEGTPSRPYRAARALARALGHFFLDPTASHPERIPAVGPVLIAATHRSLMDLLALFFLTDRKLFLVTKAELFRFHLFGDLLVRFGGIAIDRSMPVDRAAIYSVLAALDSGLAVVIFPEGTLRSGPDVTLTDGTMYLASRADVPVVPVALSGTDHSLSQGAHWPRRARVKLVVANAITPPSPGSSRRVPRSGVSAATKVLAAALECALAAAQ